MAHLWLLSDIVGERTECCWIYLVKSLRVEDREDVEIAINMHLISMMGVGRNWHKIT
jgi:hypothetical protein